MPGNNEPYWLGRATEEQQRLIKQHYIWTKAIGYLLHPSIVKTLPKDARIADIGTGTGIWPSELSKASPPTYQFTGFDISSNLFLPADSLPSNVTLQLGNFKEPFPEALHGKFDVVNARLLISALGEGAWEPALQNILQLLKPGGAICWTEGDFVGSRAYRGADPNSTPGHALTRAGFHFMTLMKKRFGFNFPDFRELFEGGGLERVEEDVLSSDRLVEQRGDFNEVQAGAILTGLRNMALRKEKGEPGTEAFWDVQEVERTRALAVQEMESGAYMRCDIHVTIGFKKA
ncbi:S-adenosyl-L-methionine-dependent methyltransferase [Byssothecium circinans]|uniref:S-adenosyl-L-methionine-dependent methyltransferase n=1 Tax=Byssothecium circinans TaxID=147558 RepID=A0A6A5U2R2_9PLEO|nr:S-adenosyl-L-methionine-dependent methyltransferase [Byssothecium circinans]